MLFQRRSIEAVRARHVQSLQPTRIALPPLRFGVPFLDHWPIREYAAEQSWRAADYDTGAPALFVLQNAVVHSSFGIVTLDRDAVDQTLIHLQPDRIGCALTPDTIAIASRATSRVAGTHVCLLAGNSGNYFHAMLDGIARSIAVPPNLVAQSDSFLIPANTVAQREMFPLLGHPNHIRLRPVEDSEALEVETLILPLTIYGTSGYHPIVGTFFDRISANVADDPMTTFPEHIYLSRARDPNRRLCNEPDLIDKLAASGIVPINPATLPIADQIRLFRHARTVIAPHGAALTNLGFCRPGTRILELHMDAYVHWGFRHLAALRGLDYDCIVGRAIGPWPVRSPAVHALHWRISIDHVIAALENSRPA